MKFNLSLIPLWHLLNTGYMRWTSDIVNILIQKCPHYLLEAHHLHACRSQCTWISSHCNEIKQQTQYENTLSFLLFWYSEIPFNSQPAIHSHCQLPCSRNEGHTCWRRLWEVQVFLRNSNHLYEPQMFESIYYGHLLRKARISAVSQEKARAQRFAVPSRHICIFSSSLKQVQKT